MYVVFSDQRFLVKRHSFDGGWVGVAGDCGNEPIGTKSVLDDNKYLYAEAA